MMTTRGLVTGRTGMLCGLTLLLVSPALCHLRAQETVFTVSGTVDGGLFGFDFDVLGDVDGDGVDDLLVGNPGPQRVWVVSGRDGHPIHILTGIGVWRTNFGYSVAGLGDLDGDNVDDFAVAPGGHAQLVFFSGKDASVIRHLGIEARELSNAGDLNQDGVTDVLALSGRGYVAISGLDGSILMSTNPPNNRPKSVMIAGVGDLDGDGVPDFAHASTGLSSSSLSIISGRTRTALWTRSFSDGISVSAAGDINMDGVSDVAVGLPNFTTPNGMVGAVVIYSGTNGAQLRHVIGPTPQGFLPPGFGTSVSGAGDVNSDGYPDLLVGSPRRENRQGKVTGSATMISGLDGSELYTLHGDGQNDSFGRQVVAGRDLDGDGFLEFAVSSTRGPNTFPFQGPGYVRLFTEVQPTYTTFGEGCPGSAGIPTLSVVDQPQVGKRFSIQIDNLGPLQLGVVFTGFSDELWAENDLALPLELSFLGFPGCQLLVSPDFDSVVGSTILGTANWGFDMADMPELYGLEFFNQAFFVDTGSNPFTIFGSNAGKGKVGS